MAKIWIVMKNPGGFNAVWPVGQELEMRGHDVLYIVNGKAVQLISEKETPYLVAWDTNNIAKSMHLLDVYVTSMCSQGGVGRDLIPFMRGVDVPTISVLDYWGSQLTVEFASSEYWPDAICVQDGLAKEIVLDAWPGYQEPRVHITGQPAFDSLVNMNLREIKRQVRQRAGFRENWPVVLYAGQVSWSARALLELINTLNVMSSNTYLVALKHPRFNEDASEEEQKVWTSAINEVGRKITLIDTRLDIPIDNWIAASDLVAAVESTVLVTGAYLRKECLSIIVHEKKWRPGAWGLPLERLGSCAVARTADELYTLTAKALSPEGLGLGENQEKHFVLDGRSTSRVADVVLNLIKH